MIDSCRRRRSCSVWLPLLLLLLLAANGGGGEGAAGPFCHLMEAATADASGSANQDPRSPGSGGELAGAPRRFAGRAEQLEADTVALRQKVAEAEAEEERVSEEVEALREERRVLVERCERISGFIMGWNSRFRKTLGATTRGLTAARAVGLGGNSEESQDGDSSWLDSGLKEAQQAYDQAVKELEEALRSKTEAEAYLENLRFDVNMLREECERNSTAITLRAGRSHVLPGASERGGGASRFRWVVRVEDERVLHCWSLEEECATVGTIGLSSKGGATAAADVFSTNGDGVASAGGGSAFGSRPPSSCKRPNSGPPMSDIDPGEFELPCELVGAGVGTCVVTIHRFPIAAESVFAAALKGDGAACSDDGAMMDGTASSEPVYRRALAETTLVGVPIPECPARELPYEAFLITVVDGAQCPDDGGSDRTPTPPRFDSSHGTGDSSWWAAVPVGQGMDYGLELIRAQFRRLDERGAGVIAQQELAHLLQALDAREWTDKRVERLLRATNARSANGGVRYEEFLGWLFDGGGSVGAQGALGSARMHEQYVVSSAL